MPAVNMGTSTTVPANPSTGSAVLMSLFSGPKNSPLDARTITGYTNTITGQVGVPIYANDPTNYSTGQMATGIGFGLTPVIDFPPGTNIPAAGFTDSYIPGVTLPSGVAATSSILMAIGGGKSEATQDGECETSPYTTGLGIGQFGSGASRDATAGPIYQGFNAKMVTAIGSTAPGVDIEAGFVNRTVVTMTTGQSAFGSATAASGVLS